jgi:hypothetical protein
VQVLSYVGLGSERIVLRDQELEGVPFPPQERRSSWRWLFPRWWWLLAVCAGIGGAIGWSTGGGSNISYQAESVVAAVETPIPVEDFDVALTLFSTDAVIQPAIDQVGLDVTPRSLLSSRQLDAEPVTGGALRVVSRTDDAELAVSLANAAAESFVLALENRDLGNFSVLPASVAAEESQQSQLAALGGAAVGLVLGIFALLASSSIRQPILSEGDALSEFPADAVFSARVRVSPTLRNVSGRDRLKPLTDRVLGDGSDAGKATVFPRGVVAAVLDSAYAYGGGRRGPLCCLLVERRRRGDNSVRGFLAELGVSNHWSDETKVRPGSRYWIRTSDEELADAVEKARVAIVLVSRGAPRSQLHAATEEYMIDVGGERRWVIVFVRPAHRLLGGGAGLMPGPGPRLQPKQSLPTQQTESEERQAKST